MRKGFGIPAICVVLCILLTGCCRPECGPCTPYRVIAEIEVEYRNGPVTGYRKISSPAKMQQIVDYLRTLNPYGVPRVDPEQMQDSNCIITLHYTDNSSRTYHQRSDQVMRIDDGPWKRIDPQKAVQLNTILETMTSDAPAKNTPPQVPLLRPYL